MKEGGIIKEYTLGLYEKSMPNFLTIEEKLNCTRKCGFDTLEISIDETDEKLNRLNMTKKERNQIVDAMFKSGIPIRTMCLSGHRKYPLGSLNEETRKKGMDIMGKAIEFADDLGIRIIQIAGYDVYYEEGNEKTREYFLKNIKKSVEMAANKGVTLAFETMETDFMNTVEKAMKYVNAVKSPYLQVYPDCGNVTNAVLGTNITPTEDLEKGAGHLVAAHLKETAPQKFRDIPYGAGHVNFEEIINKCWELGVRKYTLEFWCSENVNWEQVIKDAKKFMNNKFERVLK